MLFFGVCFFLNCMKLSVTPHRRYRGIKGFLHILYKLSLSTLIRCNNRVMLATLVMFI